MMGKMLLLCGLASMLAVAAAGDLSLPAPQKDGGPALFRTIDRRGSAPGGDFPSKPVSLEDLSTILWSAAGLNRDGVKWTVPMAMGRAPYCTIYVAMADGAYRYDWKAHKLIRVSGENVIPSLATQAFAKNAPTTLYIVGNGAEFSGMSGPLSTEGGVLLAGAMSQNIYLACEGLGVGARLIYSFDRALSKQKLGLDPRDQPYFAIPLGKR